VRAVCYLRVSSQAQRDADTIESQRRVLPDFCARREWALARPVDTYVDDGRSAKAGRLEKRLGLAALMRDAAAGMFDVVVAMDVDRLTRSEDLAERGAILGAFQRAGVKIASALSGQVLDLSTSSGDLFSTLAAFFSAEENRKRRDRTVEGKLTAIKRGRKPAGPTPFGLSYDRTTHTWAVHPVNGPVVVEIFERLARGESCQSVANDLELRGVERLRSGRWLRERVNHLARQRTYLGEWVADRARKLVIPVPRLVSDELWERTQAALTSHGRRGTRRTRHIYLLEGLAICGACGAAIGIRSGFSWGPGKKTSARYVCADRRRPTPGTTPCAAPTPAVPAIDASVWEAIEREINDPDLLAHVLGVEERRQAEGRDWAADAKAARDRLARLERTETGVLRRYREGAISDGALDRELAEIQRARDMAKRQLETAEQARAGIDADAAHLSALRAGLDGLRARIAYATAEERQALVRVFVAPGGAVFRGDQVQLTLRVELEDRATVPPSVELVQECSSG
jgi:site-specific DNA recombinase